MLLWHNIQATDKNAHILTCKSKEMIHIMCANNKK